MTNIAIIFSLLVAPYFVARVFHLNVVAGGRIGICAVFLFAAIGHFFKTEQMMQMLPSSVLARRALIYISGVVEVLFAIAVLAMPNPFYVGLCIIGYLIVIFPSKHLRCQASDLFRRALDRTTLFARQIAAATVADLVDLLVRCPRTVNLSIPDSSRNAWRGRPSARPWV